MTDRVWYAANALMADLTNRHHHTRAASEEELERKMGERYPEAVAVLGARRSRGGRAFLARNPCKEAPVIPEGGEVRTSENLHLIGGRVNKGLLSFGCSGRSGCYLTLRLGTLDA
jgi:hypothetical protein